MFIPLINHRHMSSRPRVQDKSRTS